MPLRVLVVDDAPVVLDLIDDFFTSQGADVVTSDFPNDIAGLIGRVHPDVLLLDLVAPSDNLAGLVMLGRLRADPLTATLPVLLMSADHAWLSGQAARLQTLGVTVV